MTMHAIALAGVFALSVALAPAGAADPEFEVASVKPSDPNVDLVDNHLPNLHASQGRLRFSNIRLQDLIMLAYGLGKGSSRRRSRWRRRWITATTLRPGFPPMLHGN